MFDMGEVLALDTEAARFGGSAGSQDNRFCRVKLGALLRIGFKDKTIVFLFDVYHRFEGIDLEIELALGRFSWVPQGDFEFLHRAMEDSNSNIFDAVFVDERRGANLADAAKCAHPPRCGSGGIFREPPTHKSQRK